MGICQKRDTRNSQNPQNAQNKQNPESAQNVQNVSFQPLPYKRREQSFLKVSRSICIIKSKTQTGTGFLLKYLIKEKNYYFLISNEHIITNDMINNQEEIEVIYDNKFKTIKIVLNQDERYIKTFKDKNLDIAVVQILHKDNIEDGNFLLAKENIDKNELISKNIYIPQYPEVGEKTLILSYGNIKEINKDNEICHSAKTSYGSSGSPIFLENTIEVIGIHKQKNNNNTENYADFIYPIFETIKNYFENKTKNKEKEKEIEKEIKKKDDIIDYTNVKIYYENGKLEYEGGFFDNKFEGYGKYYYLNGKYYEGQFKNGLRNGNGKLYYSNGNIIYEGDFVNDKFEGNGKYIYEGGEYYNGQWKEDKKNGKGSLYAKNGNIIYVGDFVNDNYEGNGRKYIEGGGYYDGQWKK